MQTLHYPLSHFAQLKTYVIKQLSAGRFDQASPPRKLLIYFEPQLVWVNANVARFHLLLQQSMVIAAEVHDQRLIGGQRLRDLVHPMFDRELVHFDQAMYQFVGDFHG